MSKDDDVEVTLSVVSGEKIEKNDDDKGNPLTEDKSKDEMKTDDVFTDETGEPPESFFDDFLKEDFLESLAVVDTWDPDGDENGSVEEEVKQCESLEAVEEEECENKNTISKREKDEGKRNKEKGESRTRHGRSSRRSSEERGTGRGEHDKERETVEKYLRNIDKDVLRRYLSERDRVASDKDALDKYLRDISREILAKIQTDKGKTSGRSSKSRDKRSTQRRDRDGEDKEQNRRSRSSKGNVSGKDQDSHNRDTGKKDQRKSRERSSDRKVKRERDRSSDRKGDRSTERKRDRSTERKRDRSTEKKRDRNTERRERDKSSERKERGRSADRRNKDRSSDRRGRERSIERRRRGRSIERRERNKSIERRESPEEKETYRIVEWKARESPEESERCSETKEIEKTVNKEKEVSEHPLRSDFHDKSNSERSLDRHDGDKSVDIKEKAVDKETSKEQSSDIQGSEVNKQELKKESDSSNENTIKGKCQDEKLIQTARGGFRKKISINFQRVVKKPTLVVSITQNKPFPLNDTKLDTCIKDLDDLLPPGTEDLILPAENEKSDIKLRGGKANVKSLSEWLRKDVNTKDKPVEKIDMFRVNRPMVEKSSNEGIVKDMNTEDRMPIVFRPREVPNVKAKVPVVYRPTESEFKNTRVPIVYRPTESEFKNTRVPIVYRPMDRIKRSLSAERKTSPLKIYDYEYHEGGFRPMKGQFELFTKKRLLESNIPMFESNVPKFTRSQSTERLIDKRRLRQQANDRPCNIVVKDRWLPSPPAPGPSRLVRSISPDRQYVREKYQFKNEARTMPTKKSTVNDRFSRSRSRGRHSQELSVPRSRSRERQYKKPLYKYEDKKGIPRRSLSQERGKRRPKRSHSPSWDKGKRRPHDLSPVSRTSSSLSFEFSPVSSDRSRRSVDRRSVDRRSVDRRSLDRLSRSLSRERRRHEKKRRSRRSYSRASSRSGSYISLSSLSDDSRYRRPRKRKRSPFWKEIERKFANDFVKTVTSYSFSTSTGGTITQAYASSSTTHPTLPPGGSTYPPADPYSNVSSQYPQQYPPATGFPQPYPQAVPPDNQNVPPHYMPTHDPAAAIVPTHVPPPVPPPVYNVPPPAVPMEYPVPVVPSGNPTEPTLENVFKRGKPNKLRPNIVPLLQVPPPPKISKKMSLSSILEASVKVGGPKDKKQMLFDPAMVMRCEEAIHALQDDLLLVPSGHFVLQETPRPYSPTAAAAQASKEDINKFQSPILRALGAELSFTCIPVCDDMSGQASEPSYTYKLPKKDPVPEVPVEQVTDSRSVGIQCEFTEPKKTFSNAATMANFRDNFKTKSVTNNKCVDCERRKNLIMVWNATQTPHVQMFNKAIQLSPPRHSERSRSITPPRSTTRRSQKLGRRDSPRRDSPRRDDDRKFRRSNSPQPGMRSSRRSSNFDKETLPSHSSMFNPNPNKPLAPAPPKGILKTSSNPYPSTSSQTSTQSHEIPHEFSRFSSPQTPSSMGSYRESELYDLRGSSSSLGGLGSSSAMRSSLHEPISRSPSYSDSASSSSRLPNPFSTSFRGSGLLKTPVTGNFIPDMKKHLYPR